MTKSIRGFMPWAFEQYSLGQCTLASHDSISLSILWPLSRSAVTEKAAAYEAATVQSPLGVSASA